MIHICIAGCWVSSVWLISDNIRRGTDLVHVHQKRRIRGWGRTSTSSFCPIGIVFALPSSSLFLLSPSTLPSSPMYTSINLVIPSCRGVGSIFRLEGHQKWKPRIESRSRYLVIKWKYKIRLVVNGATRNAQCATDSLSVIQSHLQLQCSL